jgi:hypothetical protein
VCVCVGGGGICDVGWGYFRQELQRGRAYSRTLPGAHRLKPYPTHCRVWGGGQGPDAWKEGGRVCINRLGAFASPCDNEYAFWAAMWGYGHTVLSRHRGMLLSTD